MTDLQAHRAFAAEWREKPTISDAAGRIESLCDEVEQAENEAALLRLHSLGDEQRIETLTKERDAARQECERLKRILAGFGTQIVPRAAPAQREE